VKLSQAANDNQRNDLIRRTRRTWQPRLGHDVSSEDARQIVENVSGFFRVLADWSRSEKAISANDNQCEGALTACASYGSTPAAEEGAPDHA
jgi:hypothetical protein